MNLSEDIKEICQRNNIAPSRSKGQNFLIAEDIYDQIIEAADLKPADVVLEVGPGFGFLTKRLATKVKEVVAVELDDKLAKVLREKLNAGGIKNVEVINEDVLQLETLPTGRQVMNHELPEQNNVILRPKAEESQDEYAKLRIPTNLRSFASLRMTKNYKIVANLPYNITSIFLRKFLTTENKPLSMTLMLQKEVAERIVAKPGEMSILSVSVQYYADVKIIDIVSREKFWPQPEVDSAIIKIDLKLRAGIGDVDKDKDFFRLVRIGFSSRRKMLKNNLAAGYRISQEIAKNKLKIANLDEKIRAQDLSLSDWQRLFVQLR